MKKIFKIMGDVFLLILLSFLKDLARNVYSGNYFYKKSQDIKAELRELCH
jgi:hypothetical protein